MKVKFLVIICAVLLISSCGNSEPQSVSRTEYALGTIVTVRIDGMSQKSADKVLDAAFERLFEIEAVASAKNPGSELYEWNLGRFWGLQYCSEELVLLFETSAYYRDLTDGAFDTALGEIVDLWGIGSENARVPSEDEIAKALNLPIVKTDLGAIAKGYAADELKRVLLENGVENAILDLGGDITTIGNNNDNGWLIGIAHPRINGEIFAKLRISDKAVVTSGDYERYFMHEGRRYHHIFDPATGYPADSGIISATVISDDCTEADALSTAFFVMGVEKAAKLAEELEIDYILIDSDMNFHCSEGILSDLEIIN